MMFSGYHQGLTYLLNYPASQMFQETAPALVETHPIFKDKGTVRLAGHSELAVQCRDLKRMKANYEQKRNRSQSDTDLEDSLTSVKHMKIVNLLSPFFCYLASCKKNFHHYMLLKPLILLLCNLLLFIVILPMCSIILHTNCSLDKKLIAKAEDLVCACCLWLTPSIWLFDVGYSQKHRKFLSFLDAFIFKKLSLPHVPRSVKSLYNNIQ